MSELCFFFLFGDGNGNFFFLWPMFRAGTARNGPKKTNKFPLPSTKSNKQSSVPSKADGTKSPLQFQQAKSLSTEAFFENPSTVIDNIFTTQENQILFSKVRDDHLEVFFPLTTIKTSYKSEDANFFSHPSSTTYRFEAKHNFVAWPC